MPSRLRGAAPVPGRRRRGLLLLHELRALLGVAGPIIVAQVGAVAMHTTDTIMVGPLGAEALAAAGIASAIHVTMYMLCFGTLMGMGPLVSQAFGAGDLRECRRLLVQGTWLALLLGVPLGLAHLAGGELARALGQQPRVAELAGGYLVALAPGAPVLLLFAALRQYLEGMGLTRPAMVVTFVAVLLNVAANQVLIFGVGGWVEPMGVVGSGWATTLARGWMLLALAGYVASRPSLNPFRGASLRPHAARLRRMLRIGAPIGAQLVAEVGIFACAAVMMGWLGPVQQAAHQVTINLASVTFMVAMGTSLAGSIRVGQHVGAGSTRGVRRAALGTYLVATGFMGMCALLFLALPEFLIGLYTTDPRIVGIGVSLLFMAAAFQVFDGAQVAGLQVLRGAADTRVPMLITLAGYWLVGAPAAWYLGFRTSLGPTGIWAGLVVGLAVVALMLAWRVRRVVWRRGPIARAA
ncbi:MAG TPA: MATE family efflux transporter [Longimicrobiaceae bacterium]|nr:MATE family efflux transporter [Longimicrobiaceae bacterium]